MFLRKLWMMMSRVKTQHIGSITSKHVSENKATGGKRCLFAFSVLCSASAFGIMVVIGQVSKELSVSGLIPSLIFAAIISVFAGLCQAECLTSHPQDVRSLYSRFYQSTCEILAYILGWTWLLSLGANLAIITRVLSSYIDNSVDYKVSHFFHNNLSPSCPDVLSVVLTVNVLLLSLTGVSGTSWWFLISMPVAFFLSLATVVISYVYTENASWSSLQCFQLPEPDELLLGAALCSSVFIGSASVFRIPANQQRVSRTLGLYNVPCLMNVFSFALLLTITESSTVQSTIFQFLDLLDSSVLKSAIAVLTIASLCLLAVEFCYPILALVDDMASDGLLFRGFSKKSKTCCQTVSSFSSHLLVAVFVGTLAATLSVGDILRIAATAPLFINTVVSVQVLLQRYHDQDSWQYEPMLQNAVETSRERNRSKSTSIEFLPRTSTTEPNVRPNPEGTQSDSEDSSGTDIDAAFQEYKKQVELNALNHLEVPTSATTVQEPTPSTSFRAKLLVAGLMAIYLVMAVVITVELRTKNVGDVAVVAISVISLLLSVVILGLLQRLPQNASPRFVNKPQTRVPLVPWIPGFTSMICLCLLVYLVPDVWPALLIWTVIGLFLYLTYGIRSSTAASSFYAISSSAQLALQPIPSYHLHRTQMIPAQRRPRNKRIQANQ